MEEFTTPETPSQEDKTPDSKIQYSKLEKVDLTTQKPYPGATNLESNSLFKKGTPSVLEENTSLLRDELAMQSVLNSWEEIPEEKLETDKKIFYLISSNFFDDYVPYVFEFGNLEKQVVLDMKDDERLSEQIGDVLIRYATRKRLGAMLEGEDTDFSKGYLPLNTILGTHNEENLLEIEETLKEVGKNLFDLSEFWIKNLRGEALSKENFNELFFFKDSETHLLIGDLQRCLKTQIQGSDKFDIIERVYALMSWGSLSEVLSYDLKVKVRFWKDFVENGYDESKVKQEYERRVELY